MNGKVKEENFVNILWMNGNRHNFFSVSLPALQKKVLFIKHILEHRFSLQKLQFKISKFSKILA